MRDVTASLCEVSRPGLAKSIISCRKLFIILNVNNYILQCPKIPGKIKSKSIFKMVTRHEKLKFTTATLQKLLRASWPNCIGDPSYKVPIPTYSVHLSPVTDILSVLSILLVGRNACHSKLTKCCLWANILSLNYWNGDSLKKNACFIGTTKYIFHTSRTSVS